MKKAVVEIRSVKKNFRNKTVLENLNLEIFDGEFLSVVGSSGGGKSTLLRLIAGLDKANSGEISFSGAMNRSFVFQSPTLLPWLTVAENILIPFKLQKQKPVALDEILSTVGLTDAATLFPHQLSGGMQMRVSIARALITGPELLLMDEPFSALDEITRYRLQEDLRRIWRQKKMTLIFVTHSLSEALYLSDRVVGISGGAVAWEQDVDFGTVERTQNLKNDRNYLEKLAALGNALRGCS